MPTFPITISLTDTDRVKVSRTTPLILDQGDKLEFRVVWRNGRNDVVHIRFTNFYEAEWLGGTEHNKRNRGPFRHRSLAFNPKRGKFVLRQTDNQSKYVTEIVNDRPLASENKRKWKYDIEWFRIHNNKLTLVDDLDPHVRIKR